MNTKTKGPQLLETLSISVIRIGFKPMTYCLEGSCSIQLSYRTSGRKDNGIPLSGKTLSGLFRKLNLQPYICISTYIN
jgi:hypothetical protein